jgi:hypothetical protein
MNNLLGGKKINEMKGILFGGCSFTWGQGLYYYSDLENLPFNCGYGFPYDRITQSMVDYKNSIRFSRLVSQHFETFEVCKKDEGSLLGNGGSEDETFVFFDYIFDVEKKYKYQDFSHIIIQLTNTFRSDFYFNLDGINYKTKIHENNLYNNVKKDIIIKDKLEKFCEINNFTFEDVENIHINNQYNKLKENVLFYLERGIKVKILNWTGDLLKKTKHDNFFDDKNIELNFNGKSYDTLLELMDVNKDLTIKNDLLKKYSIFCEDVHPSKECHQIIANSIIKSIENN